MTAGDDNFEEWEVHYPSAGSPKQHRGIDLLQQQYYPDILTDRDLQAGNYKPETEAEIAMNELWIARRRQEVPCLIHCIAVLIFTRSQAFEWKAKQNVDLIMDRRSLHKSRMESEALRRQETSSYLAMKLSKSNSQNIAESEQYDEETKSVKPFSSSHLLIPLFHSRFAPRMRRLLSGRKHYH